jgi:hypothetical protein
VRSFTVAPDAFSPSPSRKTLLQPSGKARYATTRPTPWRASRNAAEEILKSAAVAQLQGARRDDMADDMASVTQRRRGDPEKRSCGPSCKARDATTWLTPWRASRNAAEEILKSAAVAQLQGARRDDMADAMASVAQRRRWAAAALFSAGAPCR